jgi:hypothetical protein
MAIALRAPAEYRAGGASACPTEEAEAEAEEPITALLDIIIERSCTIRLLAERR